MKEYLQKAYMAEYQIKSVLDEIEKIEALATKVTSTLTHNKIFTNSKNDRIAECMIQKEQILKELEGEYEAYLKLQKDIKKIIQGVKNETQRHILHERYINSKTFDEIAAGLEHKYCSRHIERLHNYAMADLEKKYKHRMKYNATHEVAG